MERDATKKNKKQLKKRKKTEAEKNEVRRCMTDRVSSDSLSHCHSPPTQARQNRRQAIVNAINMAGLTDVELLQPFLGQLCCMKNDKSDMEDLKKADDTIKKDAVQFNELTRKAMLCLHAYQRVLVLRSISIENLKCAFEKAAPALPTLGDVNSLEKSVTFWRDAEFLMKRLNAVYA